MTAAYDAAWQHMRTNRPTLTVDQVQVLKKTSADYSGVRLHGATGLGAAKSDCIARRLRATTPRTARFAASAIRPFGHVVLQPTSCTSVVPSV